MEKITINRLVAGLSLFLIFSFFLVLHAEAFQFNVDPPKVNHVIKAGDRKNGYVTLSNFGSKKSLHVKAYVEDVIIGADGTNDFLPAGKTPWSCANWISLRPKEFDIPAEGQTTIKYTVKVPQEAKGGYYAVIFFEMLNPPAVEETTTNMSVRLGTVVLVSVKGTEVYNAQITDLTAKFIEEKEEPFYEIACTIYNAGNILIRPKGPAQILNADGREVKRFDFNPNKGGVLPGTSRKFTLKLKESLPVGKYEVKVLLDYSGDTLLGARSSFNVGEQK